MKKIPPQATYFCFWCKEAGKPKVRAVWRIGGDDKHVACGPHKPQLQKLKDARHRVHNQEPSEADYQTWMRLK